MSFVKESQELSLDGTDILGLPAPSKLEPVVEEDVVMVDDDLYLKEDKHSPSLEDVLIELNHDPDGGLVLTLDKVPGGLDQEDIVLEPAEIEVEEPEDVVVTEDPWHWGELVNFLPWLSTRMKGVPVHSGKDTVGLERAISYLEKLNHLISKAVREDVNSVLDVNKVECAREEILNGLDRLHERLEKVQSSKYPKRNKKKKADEEQEGLVKEAQKATRINGMSINVPLFISGLARVLINGMVSGGHDIEDMFQKLSKKFNLTSREQFELMQLLQDMNYPVRRDRGFLLDEEIDTTRSDNFDWNANYPA